MHNPYADLRLGIVADEVKRLLLHGNGDGLRKRLAEQGRLRRGSDTNLIGALKGKLFTEGESDAGRIPCEAK